MKTPATISYMKLQENYSGEYVARKGNRILVHAKTYPSLKRELVKKHLDRSKLIVGFVPPKNTISIYANQFSA